MHQTATKLCRMLHEAGYQAYFAGGAVRDMLLGLESDDIDIATNARPEEIERIFEKTFPIGKHFGVILVEEGGHHFEIATFRSDSAESDGRRPNAVLFTDEKEDVLRRDFTINALFYDPIQDKILDYVGGKEDLLEKKLLRFVGDPSQRVQEDHLRILRAVRFKTRFHLCYEPQTKRALRKQASLLKKVAPERLWTELEKMLLSPTREEAFWDLQKLGMLPVLLPELSTLEDLPDADHAHNVLQHSIRALGFLPPDASTELLWAVLFHDLGKKPAATFSGRTWHYPEHEQYSAQLIRNIAKRFRLSAFARRKISWLAENHIRFYQTRKMTRKHQLQFFDHPFFPELIELCRADALASDGDSTLVNSIAKAYRDAHDQKLLPQFQSELLSGQEIMEILGIPASPLVGQVKQALRDAQIEGEVKSKEEAREWVRNFKKPTS